MKIISKKPDNSVARRTVCKSCGATLEFVPLDIKERKDYDYTGDYEVVRFVVCPNCNFNTTVS